MGKKVFVTVGTTCFDEMVAATTSPACLQVLAAAGYTDVTLQFGRGAVVESGPRHGVEVHAYAFKPSIREDMQAADLVISHAGAGSVMEALEAQKPLVVVVNETLLNNHQIELAQRMAEEGHLVYTNSSGLAEKLRSFNPASLTAYRPGRPAVFGRLLDQTLGYSSRADTD
eukprot:m.63307 g.63307  ORF g.63307 m.63307 type:complete len:171 (+) comp13839_c0_seq1:225-737(+)